MECEKFDLKRALAGEAVQLRGGLKAFVRYHETERKMIHPLMGIVLHYTDVTTAREWNADGYFHGLNLEHDYDIIGMWPKEALTMPDSFWDMLTPAVVAIAKDKGGDWCCYEGEVPEFKVEGYWEANLLPNFHLLTAFNPEMFPDCDPKDSLIVRPTK